MTIGKNETVFAGKAIVMYDHTDGIHKPEGYAQRIAYGYDDDVSWEERFARFIQDPDSRKVTHVVIGMWDEDCSGSSKVIDALIAAKPQLPRLQALFIGDVTYEESEISWIGHQDISQLFAVYPDLEHFRIRGSNNLRFGQLSLPQLRSFTIETGGLDRSLLHEIWQANLPALEHLEIWLGSENYGANSTVDDFTPLFTGELFPHLRYLGLRDCEYTDELASLLTLTPLIERIRVLDLSLGIFTSVGAEALLACPAISKLEKLDIHHHYCTDEIVARLQALPIEVDVSGQETEGIDDEEERFIAVSE